MLATESGPMTMPSSTISTVFCTAQSEGTSAASSKSSGGRVQEVLAEVVTQQGQDEVGVEPTSRSALGPGWEPVDVQQRFQPFEGKLDLPPQPVDRENRPGAVSILGQRCRQDHEVRCNQAARVERLALSGRGAAQRRARGFGGLLCLALHHQPDRQSGLIAVERGAQVRLVRALVGRQTWQIADQVERLAGRVGPLQRGPAEPHDEVGAAAALRTEALQHRSPGVIAIADADFAWVRGATLERFGAIVKAGLNLYRRGGGRVYRLAQA